MQITPTNPPVQTGGERTRVSTLNDNSPTSHPSFDIRPRVAEYLGMGLDVVPLGLRSKRPSTANWPSREFTAADFNAENNCGIKLGKGGLTDVDLDSSEALALAPTFLPPTGFVFGRSSARASHHFYRTDPQSISVKLADPITGDTIIESSTNITHSSNNLPIDFGFSHTEHRNPRLQSQMMTALRKYIEK